MMIYAIMKAGKPDYNKKSCYDCRFCQGAVSWWCINKDARIYRGTSIPGVIKCKFWKPVMMYSEMPLVKRFLLLFNPMAIYINGI